MVQPLNDTGSVSVFSSSVNNSSCLGVARVQLVRRRRQKQPPGLDQGLCQLAGRIPVLLVGPRQRLETLELVEDHELRLKRLDTLAPASGVDCQQSGSGLVAVPSEYIAAASDTKRPSLLPAHCADPCR